jgi:hypothetical protein
MAGVYDWFSSSPLCVTSSSPLSASFDRLLLAALDNLYKMPLSSSQFRAAFSGASPVIATV